MDFDTPISPPLSARRFIEREIKPLEQRQRQHPLFDHRRETRHRLERRAPTRVESAARARRIADKMALPLCLAAAGGKGGSNLDMAVIREHLAAKGLGLFNDLQNEHSIVGNNPFVLLMLIYGTEGRKRSSSTACSRARRDSRSASPSRTTAPTPRTWRPPPCATATAGASTARRPGTRASTRRRTT
jgi:hypothetical protein